MEKKHNINHEKYMKEALKEATKALLDKEIPIGAVIVCEDQIIARAHNLTERLHDPTAHAEMQAITMAADYLGGKYLTQCTLYVTVEPCPMCAGALAWAQIKNIVYGVKDPKRGFSIFHPSLIHNKTNVISGILEKECSNLVTEFFKKIR
ncbi:MAG: nucleoside deaminase [Bacteroidales bacterium]